MNRKSLVDIKRRAEELELAIAKAPKQARAEVAFALSGARPERKLSSGEPVVDYNHPLSTEWLFDRESLAAFMGSLKLIQDHSTTAAEHLATSSRRPREPEGPAVSDVLELWRLFRREEPKLRGRAGSFTGDFIDLCELVLRPVAKRHGRPARFDTHAHKLLYH